MKEKKHKLNFSIFLRFLGIIIFIIILIKIDIKEVLKNILQLGLINILISIIILTFFHIIKSYKWKYILSSQNINLSLKKSYIYYVIGLYYGVITPGRVGDFFKVYALKREGFSMTKSFYSIVVDRITDIYIIVLIFLIGTFILIKNFYIIPVFIFFLITPFFAYNIINLIRWLIKKIKINFLEKLKKIELIKKMSYKEIIFNLTYTLSSWLIYIFLIYYLIKQVNLKFNFYEVAYLFSVSTIVSFLPISFAGIGSRDFSVILLGKLMNYDINTAITFSFIILIIFFLTGVIGLTVSLFFNDNKIKETIEVE